MVEDVTNVPNYLRTSWTESSRYYTDDIMDEIWRREASKIASHRIALFSRPFAHSPIETISWHLSKDPTSILLTCLLVFPRILFVSASCFYQMLFFLLWLWEADHDVFLLNTEYPSVAHRGGHRIFISASFFPCCLRELSTIQRLAANRRCAMQAWF